MKPTLTDRHVNLPLTNLSVAYQQSDTEFIADKCFAKVPSDKKSNVYYIYPKGAWFRTVAKKRAPSTESPGLNYELSNENFNCEVYHVHDDIDDMERENEDSVLEGDRTSTDLVTRHLMLRKELDFATTFFQTSIWTGSSTGGDITPATKWDAANSTPLEDIRAQSIAMHSKTGFYPNTLVLPRDVWGTFSDHPDILGRLSDTKDKFAQREFVARLLELDRVLVAGAVQNTAEEGDTDALSHVFSDQALLMYVNPKPARKQPSAGYTFVWTGYIGASVMGSRIKRFRMEPIASTRIEGDMAYDQKLIAADLGVFFDDVLT